jgi:hypothetical protein
MRPPAGQQPRGQPVGGHGEDGCDSSARADRQLQEERRSAVPRPPPGALDPGGGDAPEGFQVHAPRVPTGLNQPEWPGPGGHPGQPARGGGCGAVLRVLLTGQQTVSSNPARGLASHYRPCPTTTSLSRADAVRSKAVEDRVNWCGRHGIQRGQGLKTLSFTPQQRRSQPCLVFSVATVSAGAPDSCTACHLCIGWKAQPRGSRAGRRSQAGRAGGG